MLDEGDLAENRALLVAVSDHVVSGEANAAVRRGHSKTFPFIITIRVTPIFLHFLFFPSTS